MARKSAPLSLGAVLEALPLGIALTLLAALPSFFNFATDQIFEEQKSLLLRAGALMALPGTFGLLSVAYARRLIAQPILYLFAALLVTLAIATILSGPTRDAVFGAYLRRHGLVTWIALAIMFLAILSAARSSGGRDLVLRALIIGTAWPAAYLLLQRAGFDVVQWIAPNQGHQPGSTFGNHVLIGGYLAMVIPLTLMEAWRSHWAWGALSVLQVAALVVSGSRGAALALVAAASVALWRIAPRRVMVPIAWAGGIAFVLLFAVPSLRPTALTDRLNPQVGSARVRILIWGDTLRIARDSRAGWWIGHGLESLRSRYPSHYSPEIGRWEQIDAMPDRAHNEILDMLVSAGVIGASIEMAFFAAVLLAAVRNGDVALQAGAAAAVAAHVIEIQFGIASTVSRLGFLAVAAVVMGSRVAGSEESRPLTARSGWIVAAAVVGALSPWLSTLPSVINNPITSGTEDQFIAYLAQQSVSTPLLYAGFLFLAIAIARASAGSQRKSSAWWQLPALAIAGWLVVSWSIVPARADTFSAAAQSYGRDQRWPEATVAFGAAAREAPTVPDYLDGLGRASIEWAVSSTSPRREQLLAQARSAYERAIALDEFAPIYPRHLAASFRIRASFLEGAARDEALLEADRIYAHVTTWAPTLTPLWVEWAWVDIDRGRPTDGIRKLDQALLLDPQRGDAQRLQADLLAGRPPVR